MEEIWRSIVGYEGIYEISNLGRIKRILNGSGAMPGHILRPYKTNNGYFVVALHNNTIRKKFLVHRLVAEAFIGPCPPNYETNHRDGNRQNNRTENLEWLSKSDNNIHALKVLGRQTFRGETHGMSKLTKEQVVEIRRLYATGLCTQYKLGEQFGVSQSTIGRITRNKGWKHI